MNIDEFYGKVTGSLPVLRTSDDFRTDLAQALDAYTKLVGEIDTACFPDEAAKNATIGKIEAFSAEINEVVSLYYDGRRANALEAFRKQMDSPDGLWRSIGIHTIAPRTGDVPTYWFRARVFEDKRGHTFREMFHIPLNRREIVETQRYSAPGYPCLYLGNTVYSCWEEMHRRPRFDDLMFSGFRVRQEFSLYDLRIPKRKEFEGADLMRTLVRLPLVYACMVRVKDAGAPFKPEYIVPQLLIETIICKNREQWAAEKSAYALTWGVIYTSTHLCNDFYGADYLENIALPVIESDGSMNYCQVLASLFDISDPTCYEYEALKENDSRIYAEDMEEKSPEEEMRERYGQSQMGYLESRIIEHGNFRTLTHLEFDLPQSRIVEIPQDGSAVTVKVYADGPWTFEDDEMAVEAVEE